MKTPRLLSPHPVVTTTVQLPLAIIQHADRLAENFGISRHRVLTTAIAAGLGGVAATIQQQQQAS